MDARVHIFTAMALGRGGVANTTLDRFYPRGNPSVLILYGSGDSSGEALGYGLDGPGSIPGVGEGGDFLHSLMSRLVLGSTQRHIK